MAPPSLPSPSLPPMAISSLGQWRAFFIGISPWDKRWTNRCVRDLVPRFTSHPMRPPRNSSWSWHFLRLHSLFQRNRWALPYNVALGDLQLVFMLNIWPVDIIVSLWLPTKWVILFMGLRTAFGQISYATSISTAIMLGIS